MSGDDAKLGDGIEPGGIVHGEYLASVFEVTHRRIQQLAREGVLPKASRGRYPLAASIRAFIRHIRAGEMQPQAFDPERLEPFKRRAWLQGEREKLNLRELAGELMPRAEFEDALARIIKAFVQKAEAVPDQLERDGEVTPKGIASVEASFAALRMELHEELGKIAESMPSRSASERAG